MRALQQRCRKPCMACQITGYARLPARARYLKAPDERYLRRLSLCSAAGAGGGSRDSADDIDVDAIMRKYGGSGSSAGASGSSSKRTRSSIQSTTSSDSNSNGSTFVRASAAPAGNGLFILLALNFVVFFCDHLLHLPGVRMLYLNHAHPQWWQWITHAFCHGAGGTSGTPPRGEAARAHMGIEAHWSASDCIQSNA